MIVAGKILLASVIALMPVSLSACGSNHNEGSTVTDTARVPESNLLPLPVIPDSIFDPMDRADYTVLHYWDSLSPDDSRINDKSFMDANFAQYAEQFNYASEEGAAYAVSVLIDQSSAYPEQLKMFADLAIKHFGIRGSKTFSERSLMIWMKEVMNLEALDESLRAKYAFMFESASKNAPGRKAADIKFSTRGGQLSNLYSLPKIPYTLLVLFDPDCETCHETIEKVKNDKRLMKPVEQGQVRVLLIDVADDRSAFEYDSTQYPARWIVGYDESRIEDNDIYIFDSTPTFYLLDSDFKVILKDATIDELIDYARSTAGA